jgi:hypothetical protein
MIPQSSRSILYRSKVRMVSFNLNSMCKNSLTTDTMEVVSLDTETHFEISYRSIEMNTSDNRFAGQLSNRTLAYCTFANWLLLKLALYNLLQVRGTIANRLDRFVVRLSVDKPSVAFLEVVTFRSVFFPIMFNRFLGLFL